MALTPYQITLLRLTVKPLPDGTFGKNYMHCSPFGTTAGDMDKLKEQGYLVEKDPATVYGGDRMFFGTQKAKQFFKDNPEHIEAPKAA